MYRQEDVKFSQHFSIHGYRELKHSFPWTSLYAKSIYGLQNITPDPQFKAYRALTKGHTEKLLVTKTNSCVKNELMLNDPKPIFFFNCTEN
jgi:hypothetical protein